MFRYPITEIFSPPRNLVHELTANIHSLERVPTHFVSRPLFFVSDRGPFPTDPFLTHVTVLASAAVCACPTTLLVQSIFHYIGFQIFTSSCATRITCIHMFRQHKYLHVFTTAWPRCNEPYKTDLSPLHSSRPLTPSS